MLLTLLNILFVINCLVLIGAILLQAGSGGGLGAGFSGGSATTAVFGGRGPGALLAKVTIACATIFMVMSLLLAFLSSKPQSVLDLTGEDQVVGNTEDDVIEEGTLDIDLKSLKKQNVNVKLKKAPKSKATPKTPVIKTIPKTPLKITPKTPGIKVVPGKTGAKPAVKVVPTPVKTAPVKVAPKAKPPTGN